jgi:hypothetical protein
MKNYLLLIFSLFFFPTYGQSLPDYFLDGKSVVLISNAPMAKPSLSWKDFANQIHQGMLNAGGDPVEYYELEQIILSEDSRNIYLEKFKKRNISSIVICTRKSNGEVFIHINPFSKDKNIAVPGNTSAFSAPSIEAINSELEQLGKQTRSKNLLVLEIPEFLNSQGSAGNNSSSSTSKFIARNPLNLDVFKLGIPLAGTSGDAAFLGSFRYDILGKSQEQILAEQKEERNEIEAIIKSIYPHQVEFLTEFRSDADLIKDRVQFVLMKSEAREGELKKSLGLEVDDSDSNQRLVVKYYIKFLVRNELYAGPIWDADPDWRVALRNFLGNLNK